MAALNLKVVDRLCLVAAIIMFLLCGYWLLNRTLKQDGLVRQEKALLTKQMNDMRLAERNTEQLKASIKAAADELMNLNKQIPEDVQIGTFLKHLDGLIRKRNIELITVQPQPVIKEKLYQKIPIRLSCKGSFVKLYQLIQDLDSMERLITMERMAIGKPEQSGDCQLDLTVLVFAREPKPSGVK